MRVTCLLRRRFVPPWERDGKTADAFFAGLMQSSNPILQQRKQAARLREQESQAIRDSPSTAEDERRRAEAAAQQAALQQQRRAFLPYAATPVKYFDTTRMAAWGDYQLTLRQQQNQLHHHSLHDQAACDETRKRASSTGGYSAETMQLLAQDMEDKLPYRYTQYVPPPPPLPPTQVLASASSSAALTWPLHGTAGIVFDIDGVVCRGKQVIPGMDTAVQTLHTLRVPFLFMTNGAPKSEAEKAAELAALLRCPIDPMQVLLAHSPMRCLAPLYQDVPVLIAGPAHCGAIARSYGFTQALTLQEYQCAHPEMLPYKKWAGLSCAPPAAVPFPAIAAILQFNDPDDVFSDVQTLLDVLTAPQGRVGRYICGCQSVPYYVAADDLLWATEAPLPRLGQGAFREMLAAVYESVTGQTLEVTMYGKPRAIAYRYAERRLRAWTHRLGWDTRAMRAIFMVGDNIQSDILGANAAGGLWTSVHVLSGIGSAPAACRSRNEGDAEQEWLAACVSPTPHYVAPTADHFVRELLAFPEAAVLQHKTPYHGRPNPVNLKETYNLEDTE